MWDASPRRRPARAGAALSTLHEPPDAVSPLVEVSARHPAHVVLLVQREVLKQREVDRVIAGERLDDLRVPVRREVGRRRRR